jgi:hypothetical protein
VKIGARVRDESRVGASVAGRRVRPWGGGASEHGNGNGNGSDHSDLPGNDNCIG